LPKAVIPFFCPVSKIFSRDPFGVLGFYFNCFLLEVFTESQQDILHNFTTCLLDFYIENI
ncbi:MAG: hypothetical protein ABII27_04345, partial [bacterium]